MGLSQPLPMEIILSIGLFFKHFYNANAPPCKQCFSLTTDFIWRFFKYEKYFKQLEEECLIRNRSSRTAEAYISNIESFMRWADNKTMEELSLQDARDFILFKRKGSVAASTCNFYNSSICFLYKHVLRIPWDQDLVPECGLMHDFQKFFRLMRLKL